MTGSSPVVPAALEPGANVRTRKPCAFPVLERAARSRPAPDDPAPSAPPGACAAAPARRGLSRSGRRSRRCAPARGAAMARARSAPSGERTIDLRGLAHQPRHLGGDRRRSALTARSARRRLELGERAFRPPRQARRPRTLRPARRKCARGWRPPAGRRVRPRFQGTGAGSVRALRIFWAMVSASSVMLIRLMSEGSDFDIFFVPSRRLITSGGHALDDRFGEREELHAEIVVELRRDVARQLEMLLLVLAYRNVGGVVGEDVGRHQRRVGKEPERRVLGVLAGLVLPLGHALHPAHPRNAVEDPRQLGLFGHPALVEEDGARRIDPGGGDSRRQARACCAAAARAPARR